MFGFRPDLTRRDLDVEGFDNVPGFRVADPGFHVTEPGTRVGNDGLTQGLDFLTGATLSFTPVRWGNDDAASDNASPSFWDDVGNVAKTVGENANAAIDGAYSIFPGTANFFRAAGRGLGLYGPEEAQRFRTEMSAARTGLEYIAKDPVETARLASHGISEAFQAQPLLTPYLIGRFGMGVGLALNRLPFAPLAIAGDAMNALEKGHNFIDALGYGVGSPSQER
jgi:hypothetical protein